MSVARRDVLNRLVMRGLDFDECAANMGDDPTVDEAEMPDRLTFLGRVEEAFWADPVSADDEPLARDVSLYALNTWEQTPLLRALLSDERPVSAADLTLLHEVFTQGGIDAGQPTFTLSEFIAWLRATGDWEGTRGAEVTW